MCVCVCVCVCVYACVSVCVCVRTRVCVHVSKFVQPVFLVLCFVKIVWEKERIKQYISISIIYIIILTLMHYFMCFTYLCFPECLDTTRTEVNQNVVSFSYPCSPCALTGERAVSADHAKRSGSGVTGADPDDLAMPAATPDLQPGASHAEGCLWAGQRLQGDPAGESACFCFWLVKGLHAGFFMKNYVAPAMQQPKSATSTPLLWILIIRAIKG